MRATIGLLVPILLIASRLTAAATIPSEIQTSSQPDSTPTSSASSLSPATSLSTVPVTQEVAQKRPQTGNNYALDPFGILGSSESQGNARGGNQQGKQTSTAKTPETSSEASTSTSKPANNAESSTTTSHSESKTGTSTILSSSSTSAQVATTTTPQGGQMSTTTTANASPSPTSSQTNASSGSTSSGLDTWKIIGIGVLVFAGVVILVLGTAFQDAILNTLCRPFRRGKEDGEEVLVPDWRRGSWRFGETEEEMEKAAAFREEDEEGPRISESEKGRLGFPLPPVSPFPLRRTPSVNSRPSEPGIAGLGAGKAAITKAQGIDYSRLSPSPGLLTPQSARRSSASSTSTSRHDHAESDAYGGME